MNSFAFTRDAFSVAAAAALLAGCATSQLPVATSLSGAAPFAFTHNMTFDYTGKKQTFKVPRGVTRIRVSAVGAGGGGSIIARGGRVSAVIPVTPSETLAIYVGGAGTSSGEGFDGGGGGTGGAQNQGGAGGSSSHGNPGGRGQLRHGGAGGSGCDSSACGYPGGGGGGGGGGYYGGGGGGGGIYDATMCICGGGGGGGGSSYVERTATDVHVWRGWKNATGNGLVVFSWQ
ncbi:MAG TPA: hypothetical protein VFE16_12320 [Candidatus Cybelea sp.]|jgi:hypothetical protein|nr:hypothetical protein [Candidatus Cybelea sp.]